jgi:hypothetical protein
VSRPVPAGCIADRVLGWQHRGSLWSAEWTAPDTLTVVTDNGTLVLRELQAAEYAARFPHRAALSPFRFGFEGSDERVYVMLSDCCDVFPVGEEETVSRAVFDTLRPAAAESRQPVGAAR